VALPASKICYFYTENFEIASSTKIGINNMQFYPENEKQK